MSLSDVESPNVVSDEVREHQEAKKTLMPLGITSENIALRYGISRKIQDDFAYESHMKAAKAQKNGLLLQEITSYKATIKN